MWCVCVCVFSHKAEFRNFLGDLTFSRNEYGLTKDTGAS